MESPITFSLRLKNIRNELQMTQVQFSNFIGFTQQTLSGYENNRIKPSLDVVKDIAKKCNVSIDWLCGLTDKKSYTEELKTYSDVIKVLLQIEKSDIEWIKVEHEHLKDSEHNTTSVNGQLVFFDYHLANFFKAWKDMKKLHDNGTVDDDLYALWVKQQMEKYNYAFEPKDIQFMSISQDDNLERYL